METRMKVNEKDAKIEKMEAEVKKLKDAKDDAYEKMMKEKEKYGSSDKWFHTDVVSYRKLHDAHHDANDVWDKAYFKLKKMKEQAAKKNKSEGLDEEIKLPTGVERIKARAEKAKAEIKAQQEIIATNKENSQKHEPHKDNKLEAEYQKRVKTNIKNANTIIKNLKAFLADVPDMLKKAQANEGVIMKPAKQLMSVIESLDANGELPKEEIDKPLELETKPEDLTDPDAVGVEIEDDEEISVGESEEEMTIEDDGEMVIESEEDSEDEEELDESAKGDAKRKAAAKAQMDNKVEKIRRDSEKLQKKKKVTSDDAEYDRIEARLSANHQKVAKLKDDFKKKWN